MPKVFIEYRTLLSSRPFLFSSCTSILLFIASLLITSYAITYSGIFASNSVTDLILSNTRVYSVDGIFVYGGVLLVIFSTLVIFSKPRYIPFAIKTVALFCIIRSGFVLLTHISPFPEHIAMASSYFTTSALFKTFFTGDDLFFSAHTGLPFLLALVFWESIPLRLIFIAISLLFGTVVLLGHLHYSIDVAAAFFIVPTIYTIAKKLFCEDLEISSNALLK
jgi:hypothetical protein